MALACKFSRRDLVAEIMRTGARARRQSVGFFILSASKKSYFIYRKTYFSVGV